ncbi:MAG: homoserine dehydrogenase [Atopobium sp.]|jgi:homoserine dehydrogenase|nr:homoserine dehydrogenase [Atopobiaceae bacterium]NLH92139.1 homoserine dehydrogenase [Atopobium sp.]
MDIALLGHGTVGRGVDKICSTLAGVDVTRILELPDRCTDERMTSHFDEIVGDPDIRLILECMGGLEPAHTYIADALAAGKSVVTSNKAVVAANLAEFVELAHTTGATLMCEASVGGGVPWLSSIRKVRRIDSISAFSGIMNGTTNYLLTTLAKGDETFDEVLKEAQKLGYAERDPSADIDGIDVANKVIISCLAAFDALCPNSLPVTGIRTLKKSDVDLFAVHGRTVKLIGRALRQGDRFAACVEPVALPASYVEANVPANFNILGLSATTVGDLKFYGQGAGSLPTGNAMLQDVLDYAAGERPEFHICKDLVFDPSLFVGDYVLRADDATALEGCTMDWRSYGANAWLVRDIDPIVAKRLLSLARTSDPEAIIFARPRKDI